MQEFHEKIEPYRQKLDRIDKQIIQLLAKRNETVTEIGKIKNEAGKPIHQAKRAAEVIATRIDTAKEFDLDPEFIKQLFQLIMDESCRIQKI